MDLVQKIKTKMVKELETTFDKEWGMLTLEKTQWSISSFVYCEGDTLGVMVDA